MSVDAYFNQGDTGPDITAIIFPKGGSTASPTDLSTATAVHFRMWKDGDRFFTVEGEATVADAETGEVSYTWGSNDLAVSGVYNAAWKVTFPGKIVTTEPKTIEVRKLPRS